MIYPKPLYALASILILTAVLPGCATYSKCGFGGCPGDAKITADTRALLNQRPDLGPPNSINVETLDHVVYLSGEVSAGIMSERAESIAREAPDVARVVNSIAVAH
jgi:osmotically-inducible protein OsmY